eukprot:10781354-Alexandrium_andersonii.AAC.1
MSASLVGSEMCIRDSSRTARFVVRFGIGSKSGAEHPPQELGGSMLRPFPVSYTHLTLPTICSV